MDIFEIMPDLDSIKIIDIGAMYTEGTSYDILLEKKIAKVIGFEPNQIECEKLNKIADERGEGGVCRYYPYAIGDGTTKKMYITDTGFTSSLYLPNMELLDKFVNWGDLCHVINEEMVDTKRLDDIAGIRGADYLKIDVQGAEKDIFENAPEVLKDILVIHTEVEFIEHYKDQPLFADVDVVLRKYGFKFHKFTALEGRLFKPFHTGKLSQISWADAVYVKDFMNLALLPPHKLLKMAIILHEMYQSWDMCHYVLGVYDEVLNQPHSLAEKYRTLILAI